MEIEFQDRALASVRFWLYDKSLSIKIEHLKIRTLSLQYYSMMNMCENKTTATRQSVMKILRVSNKNFRYSV